MQRSTDAAQKDTMCAIESRGAQKSPVTSSYNSSPARFFISIFFSVFRLRWRQLVSNDLAEFKREKEADTGRAGPQIKAKRQKREAPLLIVDRPLRRGPVRRPIVRRALTNSSGAEWRNGCHRSTTVFAPE